MLDNKDSIIKNQVGMMVNKEIYITALEADVQNLEISDMKLRGQNKKLNFKLKLAKYSIPLSVGGGLLLGYLLFK